MSDQVSKLEQKRWIITETFREDGEGEVAVTPLNWVNFDSRLLHWPRDFSKKSLESKLLACAEPTKKWKTYTNFTILEDGKEFGIYSQASSALEDLLIERDTTAAEQEAEDLDQDSDEDEDGFPKDFNHMAESCQVTVGSENSTRQGNNTAILGNYSPVSSSSKQSLTQVLSNVVVPSCADQQTDSGLNKEQILNPDFSNIVFEPCTDLGSGSGQSYQVLADIPQIVVSDKISDKLRSLTVGNVIHTGKGLGTDDKINLLLANQNTILNIIGQLFMNQETMQADVSETKCFVQALGSTMKDNGPDDFLCLAEFPISSEKDLEGFNSKLKEKSYKDLMATALRFSCGSTTATVQGNVNSMMSKLFDDNVLKDYSALGVRGKKSFCEYSEIKELIWQALKLLFPGNDFKESIKDILGKIGTYLKHAPTRIKAKEKAAEADRRNEKSNGSE